MTIRDSGTGRDIPVVTLNGKKHTPGYEQVSDPPIEKPASERQKEGRSIATITFINAEYLASARRALQSIDALSDSRRQEIEQRLENGFYCQLEMTRELAVRIVQHLI